MPPLTPWHSKAMPLRSLLCRIRTREFSSEQQAKSNKNILIYLSTLALGVFGLSYAAVPLYQVFCAQTGYGGTVQVDKDDSRVRHLQPVVDAQPIKIRFVANTGNTIDWEFEPEQDMIQVVPGETALAFYKAKNLTDKNVIGVATYNVVPARAGLYFHKIQCFCFDEQLLKAGETVDMPVFFYIDPEILTDKQMKDVTQILLGYTFFQTATLES